MNFRVGNSPFTRPWSGRCRRRHAEPCEHRRVRVIHPEPADDVSLDELYGVTRSRVGDRPWVGLCMIASLDGTTVVDGRSGGLGNATDSAVLAALRRAADVIIVGAGTVRAEGYGPPRQARAAHRRGHHDGERRPGERAVHERRRIPDPARGRPSGAGRPVGTARRRAGRLRPGRPGRRSAPPRRRDRPADVRAVRGRRAR